MKLLFIVLALYSLGLIVLYKVYHSIPLAELKRRARSKDGKFSALYKTVSYGASLDVLIWLLDTAGLAALFIWSARTNWWLAAVFVVLAAWLAAWSPGPLADGWMGSLAAPLARIDAWVLSYLHPILDRLVFLVPLKRRGHTGLYEKRDLLEFIIEQNKQAGNRIPEPDLHIAFNALGFGDKTVSSVMTPRRKVKFVKADEVAGPMLTDELHKTGFSRFPVVKDSARGAAPEVIGTLYLSDLIGYSGSGKVKDLAKGKAYFINESANLRQALSAFLKTHHHLLIVVNSFEEMVGVLSLEDVMEQIIGQPIVDEFDEYEDLRAVAAHDAKKDQAGHQEVKPEPEPKEEPKPNSS